MDGKLSQWGIHYIQKEEDIDTLIRWYYNKDIVAFWIFEHIFDCWEICIN